MAITPVKIACVNTKDAGRIRGVSVEVVNAYVKQGNLQWILVGSENMIPLYEIASLRDITLKEAMGLVSSSSAIIYYICMEATAVSAV